MQLLHGVVVAGLVIGAPLYVEQCVPQQLRSTGQTSLTMLGFGLGGIVSNLATGWLVDVYGPAGPELPDFDLRLEDSLGEVVWGFAPTGHSPRKIERIVGPGNYYLLLEAGKLNETYLAVLG